MQSYRTVPSISLYVSVPRYLRWFAFLLSEVYWSHLRIMNSIFAGHFLASIVLHGSTDASTQPLSTVMQIFDPYQKVAIRGRLFLFHSCMKFISLVRSTSLYSRVEIFLLRWSIPHVYLNLNYYSVCLAMEFFRFSIIDIYSAPVIRRHAVLHRGVVFLNYIPKLDAA